MRASQRLHYQKPKERIRGAFRLLVFFLIYTGFSCCLSELDLKLAVYIEYIYSIIYTFRAYRM